jgi:hypothetical protein
MKYRSIKEIPKIWRESLNKYQMKKRSKDKRAMIK